jgi:hypothetical protein
LCRILKYKKGGINSFCGLVGYDTVYSGRFRRYLLPPSSVYACIFETQSYNPEGYSVNHHCCENLRISEKWRRRSAVGRSGRVEKALSYCQPLWKCWWTVNSAVLAEVALNGCGARSCVSHSVN